MKFSLTGYPERLLLSAAQISASLAVWKCTICAESP
jgi:hypothetical protein